MTSEFINPDLDTSKQTNFYDGQKLNVTDLEQLQVYLNDKIEQGIEDLGFDGTTRIDGLRVEIDDVMAEPFAFPTVAQSAANPSLQNFTNFPEDPTDTQETKIYQVFKAETNNLQRFDLKLQLLESVGNSVLQIELSTLSVPTNPTSSLNNSIFTKQFSSNQIPSASSDGLLTIDVSGENDNQGITLVEDEYYAVIIRFIKESGSQDQLRVFHSNTAETAAIDSSLSAWFFVNGVFQQGLFDNNAVLQELVIYHKAHTAAVKVLPGAAYFKGQPISVAEEQRFLSLRDRRNITDAEGDFTNFVAIRFLVDSTDPELHPRTGNQVDSNFQNSYEIAVFNETEWALEVAKSRDEQQWLLLAAVVDRNIIPFSETFSFPIQERTNLAYNDWLNPCIATPSLGALNLQASRPEDFIFFVDNVPTEFPLLDNDGNQVYDDLGQPLVDTLSQVILILYLDGGTNTRTLEMAPLSSTSTTPPFTSFFATITDPEGTIIPGISNFVFDLDEIAPNTFYNYQVVTTRGRSIFVQDFNTQVRTPDPNTGISSLTRLRMFETRLTQGALTAVINEDLRLGDPIVEYGNVGQTVTGFESIIQNAEVPGRVGTPASETISPIQDTLLEASDFKFEPLPMSLEDGTLITATQTSIDEAVAAEDLVIKVDGVPATWSGTEGPERGGNGAPHTVSGKILFSNDPVEKQQQIDDLAASLGLPGAAPFALSDLVNLRVTARDATGRDCSQQAIVSVTELDGSDLVYRVIAMGRGVGSPAGFTSGEEGFIYIENRATRDLAGVQLKFVYTSFGSTILDVRDIDTQEQWFGEKTIINATTSTVIGEDEIGVDPIGGQVFFNSDVQDLVFNQLNLTAQICYFQLDQRFETIQFYQTRLFPWGDANDCAIGNNDVEVQNAITNGDIAITVNGGTTIGAVDLTIGANYLAYNDDNLLDPNKIILDPIRGRIVFGDNIKPNPDDDVEITYYYLKPITTCSSNAVGGVYDAQFDFNGDGRIDETDLQLFLTAFGSSTGDPAYNAQFDFNNDGSVGDSDYDEFLARFGTVASGSPLFEEATESRLGSILVTLSNNSLRRLEVVRAVSTGPTTQFPLGRTVLFFSSETPVRETGDYTILFGYAATLVTGANEITITTAQAPSSSTNGDVIDIFKSSDLTDTRDVIDISTTTRVENNVTVYDNLLTFTPSITDTDEYTARSLWTPDGVGITNRADLIKPVEYEEKDRRKFGPFKMSFTRTDTSSDGTSLTIRFATNPEATLADGTPDPTGLHLDGVPIWQMRFAILLFVPVDNNKTNVWRWHSFAPQEADQGIKLEFNQFLSLDTRFVGKNGTPVLQPFGTADSQVDLRPKYAGGDIENDLSNIVVIRDDFISNVPPIHNHTSDIEGGVVTSANVAFEDPEARFESGSTTDVVYQIDDKIEDILSQLDIENLTFPASQIIFTDTRGCFGPADQQIDMQDLVYQILDLIGWDNLDSC